MVTSRYCTSLHVPVPPWVIRFSHQGLFPVLVCTATCLIFNNLSQLLISGTIIQIAMYRQWSILAKQAGFCTFSPFVLLPYPPCIARHMYLARVKQTKHYPPGQSRKDITSVRLSITSPSGWPSSELPTCSPPAQATNGVLSFYSAATSVRSCQWD